MLTQGDNTQAFGGSFLTVNLRSSFSEIPEITKAEFRIGCITKTVISPTFPLQLNFDEKESEQLKVNNVIYMAVWDSQNRKITCEGQLRFSTNPRRV